MISNIYHYIQTKYIPWFNFLFLILKSQQSVSNRTWQRASCSGKTNYKYLTCKYHKTIRPCEDTSKFLPWISEETWLMIDSEPSISWAIQRKSTLSICFHLLTFCWNHLSAITSSIPYPCSITLDLCLYCYFSEVSQGATDSCSLHVYSQVFILHLPLASILIKNMYNLYH